MSFHVKAAAHTGSTVADVDRALEFWQGVRDPDRISVELIAPA